MKVVGRSSEMRSEVVEDIEVVAMYRSAERRRRRRRRPGDVVEDKRYRSVRGEIGSCVGGKTEMAVLISCDEKCYRIVIHRVKSKSDIPLPSKSSSLLSHPLLLPPLSLSLSLSPRRATTKRRNSPGIGTAPFRLHLHFHAIHPHPHRKSLRTAG